MRRSPHSVDDQNAGEHRYIGIMWADLVGGQLVAERGLVKGERIGVDASTMEANAAVDRSSR